MNKVKIGIVGTGMAWELLHWPVLKNMTDYFEIVTICDTNKENAKKWSGILNISPEHVYENYNEMLKEDIDAVDINVPIGHTYRISHDAARSGRHIICEKPLAHDLETAGKYLAMSRQFEGKILIAENSRYNEENDIIKKVIKDKAIGDILYFHKNTCYNFVKEVEKKTFAFTSWRRNPDFMGGTFLDAAIHDIAFFGDVFGDVEQIFACGKEARSPYSPYESVNSILEYPNNITGHYSFSSNTEETCAPIGLHIFGTEGQIVLNKNDGKIEVNTGAEKKILSFTPDLGFKNEFLNFYNAVVYGEPIKVTPETGYKDFEIISTILRVINSKAAIHMKSSMASA